MVPLIAFAFGPDDSYYFECPTGSQWRGLPWNFQHIRQRIATSYQVCIGPGDDEYAAFYLNKDGNIQYSMNYPNNAILKPVTHGWFVATWKGQPASHILKSRLVLGPDDTYLAFTPTAIQYGPESFMMPSLVKLLQAYQVRAQSAPVITEAALGANGAWWVQFSDRTCQYDLAGGWPALAALLRDKVVDEAGINSLVLSTENTDHYFLVYDRKKVRYSLPAQYARLVGPALEEYHASQQTVSAVHEGTAAPSAGLRVGATAPRQDGNPPPPYREGNESHMN